MRDHLLLCARSGFWPFAGPHTHGQVRLLWLAQMDDTARDSGSHAPRGKMPKRLAAAWKKRFSGGE